MAETIAVEYTGDGAFEQGVPARNLTAEEWAAVPTDVQKRLIASGIYRKAKAEVKDTPKEKEGK